MKHLILTFPKYLNAPMNNHIALISKALQDSSSILQEIHYDNKQDILLVFNDDGSTYKKTLARLGINILMFSKDKLYLKVEQGLTGKYDYIRLQAIRYGISDGFESIASLEDVVVKPSIKERFIDALGLLNVFIPETVSLSGVIKELQPIGLPSFLKDDKSNDEIKNTIFDVKGVEDEEHANDESFAFAGDDVATPKEDELPTEHKARDIEVKFTNRNMLTIKLGDKTCNCKVYASGVTTDYLVVIEKPNEYGSQGIAGLTQDEALKIEAALKYMWDGSSTYPISVKLVEGDPTNLSFYIVTGTGTANRTLKKHLNGAAAAHQATIDKNDSRVTFVEQVGTECHIILDGSPEIIQTDWHDNDGFYSRTLYVHDAFHGGNMDDNSLEVILDGLRDCGAYGIYEVDNDGDIQVVVTYNRK